MSCALLLAASFLAVDAPASDVLLNAASPASSLRTFVAEQTDTEGRYAIAEIAPADVPAPTLSEDGFQRILFVFRVPGATGVRLHLSSFHLPPESSLLIYPSAAAAPLARYEGAGPTRTGSFLTPPVPGSEVLVEYRFRGEPAAQLPFEIRTAFAADAAEIERSTMPAPLPLGESGAARTSVYQGIPLTHEVLDGLAIHEGDILLGRAGDLVPAEERFDRGKTKASFGITAYPSMKWPGGVVPYTVDPSVVSPSVVSAAAAHWNSKMGGMIRVTPRTTESNYVAFTRGSNAGLCSSYIGMIGGAQPIYVGDACDMGSLVHEIGHALGLLHEHTRQDRDNYVQINWNNIDQSYANQFSIPAYGTNLGAYDYASIMHYPTWAFSNNGQPAITTIPPGIPIGQRAGLSAGDVAGTASIYGNGVPPPARSTVTLATNPAQLSVSVGGTVSVAPATITADSGTVYTVSTPTPQGSGGRRYAFGNWSNGQPRTFTLTVPSSPETITANFSTYFQLAATASYGGSVSVTPSSTDGFYPQNTSVQLSAVPGPGYCFTGWSGLAAGTPAATSVLLTGPVNASADFTAGGSASVPAGSQWAPKTGAIRTVNVTATENCGWTATAANSWIKFPDGAAGVGSQPLRVQVDANTGANMRIGSFTVGSVRVSVYQF